MKPKQIQVNYNSQSVTIPLPHTDYLDKVLRSTSYEELMWRFMQAEKPAKEITESYSAFSNLKRVCQVKNYNWLHIGDGAYTRTAAIFAFFSKTANFSIDPQLNIDKFFKWKKDYDVVGVFAFPYKYEDFKMEDGGLGNGKPYSITCVHAHVKLDELDKHFPNWHYLYTNPCCHPAQQTFSEEYMKENHIKCIVDKQDLGILSERRSVKIYVNLRQKENK